jgi:hypothetical protein
MATSRAVIKRWTVAQIQIWKGREFDSEKDLFPLLEGIGSTWLFDADDTKLVHRLPNLRPLWKENLSHVLRELVSEGIIKSVGNRGGSRYAID